MSLKSERLMEESKALNGAGRSFQVGMDGRQKGE